MPRDTPARDVPASKTVLAAGAVLWRPGDDAAAPEVAIIHRPRYDDWSLPKGKVDPGETEPVTAVREVAEETGYAAHLGRRLAAVSYPVEQGVKKVRYWAARAVGGEFTPNDEVDELKWLPVAEAMKELGYPHDRKVLRRFMKLPADTQDRADRPARHGGKQVPLQGRRPEASAWTSTAAHRPSLWSDSCWLSAPTRSTPPTGCAAIRRSNRWPRSSASTIHDEPLLTEEAYAENRKAARHRFLEIAAVDGTPGDLHAGQGDSGPGRVVVRARRRAPGQVA